MKIYLYRGKGMWGMGSSVMCIAGSEEEATRLIKENLESITLQKESDEFNFKDVQVFDLDSSKIIYSASGDY